MQSDEKARLFALAAAGDEFAERALLRMLRHKHGEAVFTKREACVRLLEKIREGEALLRQYREQKRGPWKSYGTGHSNDAVVVHGAEVKRWRLDSQIAAAKCHIRMCYCLRAFFSDKPYKLGEPQDASDVAGAENIRWVHEGMWGALCHVFGQHEAADLFGMERCDPHAPMAFVLNSMAPHRAKLSGVVSKAFCEWLGGSNDRPYCNYRW